MDQKKRPSLKKKGRFQKESSYVLDTNTIAGLCSGYSQATWWKSRVPGKFTGNIVIPVQPRNPWSMTHRLHCESSEKPRKNSRKFFTSREVGAGVPALLLVWQRHLSQFLLYSLSLFTILRWRADRMCSQKLVAVWLFDFKKETATFPL